MSPNTLGEINVQWVAIASLSALRIVLGYIDFMFSSSLLKQSIYSPRANLEH
jgi:hypothetical protein